MSKEIPLYNGLTALVDDEDYETLARYTWYGGKRRRTFYARHTMPRGTRPQVIYMHRVILGAPARHPVDHQNGDGLDNRRSNIRLASFTQNSVNSVLLSISNTSGRRGVSKRGAGRWRARIRVDGKTIVLGHFDDLDEAAKAYDVAAKRIHGEFARLNFNEGLQ